MAESAAGDLALYIDIVSGTPAGDHTATFYLDGDDDQFTSNGEDRFTSTVAFTVVDCTLEE